MRATLHAALALLLLSCGDDEATLEPTCETLACPTDSTCDDGVCLADAPEDYRVAVRFVPPDDRAAAEWEGVMPVSELGFRFQFHDRLRVRGRVLRGGDPVPAFVELSRASPLPGREPIVVGQSIRQDESFDFTVPPTGACSGPVCPFEYLVTAWSVDSDNPFPPTRVSLSDVDVGTRFDVVVPETVTIKGAVTSGIGPESQPIEHLRVLAVDPVTGDSISPSTVTSRLDGDGGGEFRLTIPATTEVFALRFAETDLVPARSMPTIQSAELSLPSLSLDPEDGAYVIPLSVGIYPSVTQIRLSGTVEGRPRAGGRVPVGGATLRFRSDDLGAPEVADVPGKMERIVRSNADGTYEVFLAAGTYVVEIRPPATNELADLAVGVVSQFVNGPDASDQSGIVLDVPPRFALGGTVEDAEGRRIEGARVDLHGGADLADRTVARAEQAMRTVYARATAEGAFLALVDPGHVDAVVRPQAESGLPWAVRLGIPVAEDTTLPARILVAPGQRLSGIVMNDVDSPAPGVEVEVWCLTEDDASIVCGRTTTDDAGRYSLLLPAALEIFPVSEPL